MQQHHVPLTRHVTTLAYGLLCANLLLHSSQARQPAADINDHESCAILGLHPGGFASNINQILLSMVLLPYSRFYVDDSDLKYRCSADGSWDDTFQGSVRSKGEESKARNCTAISVFDGVYKMNDLFAKKALEGSTGHAALFEKKLTALQELWHLPEQLKSITERHVAFVKSLPGPLTAVHVRSGDKAQEDRGAKRQPYTPHDFAKAALSYPEAHGGTCLVYGDDIVVNHATAQQLLQSLSCYPIVMGGLSTGHHQAEFNSKGIKDRCSQLHRFLAELSGMAAADYFIGSMNSNVPRLVALMRVTLNGLKKSTARDVFDMDWVAYKKL